MELREALLRMQPDPIFLLSGIVKAVDEAACTCTVMPDDGTAEYFDVRLRSQIDNKNLGIVLFPKIDSNVIMGKLDDQNCVIVGFAEISKAIIKGENIDLTIGITENIGLTMNLIQGKVSLTMNSSGVSLSTPENISVTSSKQIGLTASGDMTVQSANFSQTINGNATETASGSVGITANGGGMTLGTSGAFTANCQTANIAASSRIDLGGSAENVVTNARLFAALQEIYTRVNSLQSDMQLHTHPNLNTPSANVAPKLPLTQPSNTFTNKIYTP